MAKNARKKILVVDEDADMATMIGECLAEEGFETDKTFSGYNAFKKTLTCDYDLILADIDITDNDGTSLHGKIKKNSPKLFDKMIFTTNKLNSELKRFSEFTKRPIIEKPFTMDVFKDLLAKKLLKDYMKD